MKHQRRFTAAVALTVASTLGFAGAGLAEDWWSIPNQSFFEKYKDLATGSQEERSRFAWMLFARVNQPVEDDDGETVAAWELWASNDETFTDDPTWPSDADRGHLAFTKAKGQIPTPGGEEVVRNRESFDYITTSKPDLYTVAGLRDVYSMKKDIDFPIGAIEVKANWTTANGKTAWGAPAPIEKGMYQVTSEGTNYGLNGMHIMAKVEPTPADPFTSKAPSWFWTTFEFRDNPGRSDAVRFITHPDALSQEEVAELLAQAGITGELAEGYACNGTQIDFVDADGNQVVLGNTTMEGDFAQPTRPHSDPPHQPLPPALWEKWSSSCHSCHGQTRMTAQDDPSGSPPRFGFTPLIGPIPPPLVSDSWPLDFTWSIPDRAIPRN